MPDVTITISIGPEAEAGGEAAGRAAGTGLTGSAREGPPPTLSNGAAEGGQEQAIETGEGPAPMSLSDLGVGGSAAAEQQEAAGGGPPPEEVETGAGEGAEEESLAPKPPEEVGSSPDETENKSRRRG